MDKIAANNYFTKLRKEIKKSKAMVCGNLVRKIKELNKEKEKTQDEVTDKKLDAKIEKLQQQIKITKSLDWYEVAKDVTMKPNFDTWANLVCSSQTDLKLNAKARIVSKNNIKKLVTSFRSERTDLDEWLEEYLEFRETKKDIMENKFRKTKRTTSAAT